MAEPHAPRERRCEFRFYGPLNDFLPGGLRQRPYPHRFTGSPGLRDSVQALGVPHCEVALALVDGVPAPPEHRLRGGEQVSVYPRFHRLFPAGPFWQPLPPEPPRFILDVHLGSLSRHLRLLGFDSRWGNDFEDAFIIDEALREERIILTRDLGILKQRRVRHGRFVRPTNPGRQIAEVVDAFDLTPWFAPLTRCSRCNGDLVQVEKAVVADQLPEGTRRCYNTFFRCRRCGQVYWRGAHYRGLLAKLGLPEGG